MQEGARLARTAIELARRAGDLHGAVIGMSAIAVQARLSGDYAEALAQHLEGLEMARQLGDPELIGLELLNTVIPLVKLGRWRAAVEPWLEGVALVQEAGIDWEQIAAMSIAASPLVAAGDLEGAAQAWAMANALAGERDLKLQPADIDEEARSAIEARAHGAETLLRSLPEAVVTVRTAMEALNARQDHEVGSTSR
jgi:hypothetical protein